MSDTQITGDTKYLFRRDKTWWVKLAVPRPLRDTLGYDLRRSLHTHDIEAAREARWAAIEEFRSKFENLQSAQGAGSAAATPSPDAQSDQPVITRDGAQQVNQHIV